METGRRAAGQKRLCPNQRVSGSVGEFIEGPSNGEEKECSSNILKVESMAASLPPDVPLPVPQNVREEAMLDAVIGEVEQDADERED